MKVIKEGIDKLPEMEKKAQPVVDVVMADAKEYSDEAEKNFEKVTEPEKFDRKKAFTSGEHQPKPEEAEKELAKINLDESLFEDYTELNEMAKPIPRAIEVIDRKYSDDLINAIPAKQIFQDAKDLKAAQQYALEWILEEHNNYNGDPLDEPIYDIYWAAYDPDDNSIKTDINIYAKRILKLEDLMTDYRRKVPGSYPRKYINARDVLIGGELDNDYWHDDSNTEHIKDALDNNQIVMQYAVTPMNSNWRSFQEPRAGQALGNGSLRWGRNKLKGESLEEAIGDYEYSEEELKAVNDKFQDLSEYNFDYALDSEEDRQNAIDECTRILNILNNISVEDIEAFNYTDDEVEDDDLYDMNQPQEENESLNEGKEIQAVSELTKAAKKLLFMQPWKAREVLINNSGLVKDFIKSGLPAEKYFQKQLDYYGAKKYTDWFADGCPTKFVQNYAEALTEGTHDNKGYFVNGKDFHLLVLARCPEGVIDHIKKYYNQNITEKDISEADISNWQKTMNYCKANNIEIETAKDDGLCNNLQHKNESYNMINFTANAMKEQGLSEEIQAMRAEAILAEDFHKVCNGYLDRCNQLANEYDDEYEITGLPFVTQGLDIHQPKLSQQDLEDLYLGKLIRLSIMVDPMKCDGSCYNNVEGTVDSIDDMGQLHGSWGQLGVIPGVDQFEVL